MYDLTKPVVYRERGSRRLDVNYSTGRRPMERADEPPPPILLYQVGFGCILKWWHRSGWVGKRKARDEACGGEVRGSLVDHVNDGIRK